MVQQGEHRLIPVRRAAVTGGSFVLRSDLLDLIWFRRIDSDLRWNDCRLVRDDCKMKEQCGGVVWHQVGVCDEAAGDGTQAGWRRRDLCSVHPRLGLHGIWVWPSWALDSHYFGIIIFYILFYF